jgi:hypothetical protein
VRKRHCYILHNDVSGKEREREMRALKVGELMKKSFGDRLKPFLFEIPPLI